MILIIIIINIIIIIIIISIIISIIITLGIIHGNSTSGNHSLFQSLPFNRNSNASSLLNSSGNGANHALLTQLAHHHGRGSVRGSRGGMGAKGILMMMKVEVVFK